MEQKSLFTLYMWRNTKCNKWQRVSHLQFICALTASIKPASAAIRSGIVEIHFYFLFLPSPKARIFFMPEILVKSNVVMVRPKRSCIVNRLRNSQDKNLFPKLLIGLCAKTWYKLLSLSMHTPYTHLKSEVTAEKVRNKIFI